MASQDETPTPEAAATAPEPTPEAGTEAAAPVKKAAKRAPRKSTRKSQAPVTAPGTTSETLPAAAEPEAAGGPGATASEVGAPEAATAKKAPAKRTRKATTRKAASPGTSTVTEPGADAVTGAESGAAAENAPPATKAPRKRATKKAAPAVLEPPATAPTEPGPSEPTEPSPDDGPVGTLAQEPAAPAPSFGVLFQAPEPVEAPRRRRAASAPAGPATAGAERTDRDDRGNRDDQDAPNARDDSLDERARGQRDEADDTDTGDDTGEGGRRRRRRGGKGRRGRGGEADQSSEQADDAGDDAKDGGRGRKQAGKGGAGGDAGKGSTDQDSGGQDSGGRESGGDNGPAGDDNGDDDSASGRRRTRRRRRSGSGGDSEDPPGTVTKVREPRQARDEVSSVKGSTRLEAKKQRRREGREAGRRRTVITEAEFLARRESVERVMVVRHQGDRTQIGVLEDGVLVEHYISRESTSTMAGNVYLGRVQNVLPSMEAAFVDIGKGRNAVLYAGEVNWDAAGLDGAPKRIENALKSGGGVLAQVTKDPIGHKGARLTSQVSLPGRYLVYVPNSSMTGISRKLPDTERARLKKILKDVVPEDAGVIVRTAAEGASEAELRADVERLTKTWDRIQAKSRTANAPALLHGEADMTVRVIRDVFNEDFTKLVVAGEPAWEEVSDYVNTVAPDLADRLEKWTGQQDLFSHYRVDEALAKAMDRKVWLPSGGSLVIDRTEAMTVVDVNTGKFVGSGGNLEETVTKNNIEAAEEIVRQLRLRDIGGIIVIDFIDMVLESNRDLVIRRLLECLGRDRTKHQVAEVTSLGLVQMTRKRVGAGLIEVFSEPCEHCNGRGLVVHNEPVDKPSGGDNGGGGGGRNQKGRRGKSGGGQGGNGGSGHGGPANGGGSQPQPSPSGPTAAQIAAAAHAAALQAAAAAAETADTAASADATAPAEATAPADAVASERADVAGDGQPEAPARRGRRKRGRVVAPAGPPGGTGVEVAPAGSTSGDAGQHGTAEQPGRPE